MIGQKITVRLADKGYRDMVAVGRLPDASRRFLRLRRAVVVNPQGEAIAVENDGTDRIWRLVTEPVDLSR